MRTRMVWRWEKNIGTITAGLVGKLGSVSKELSKRYLRRGVPEKRVSKIEGEKKFAHPSLRFFVYFLLLISRKTLSLTKLFP